MRIINNSETVPGTRHLRHPSASSGCASVAERCEENQLLTPREIEIMTLLSKGLLNKEMADSLSLSLNTIKIHLKNIYQKLEVNNRLEAIIKYYKLDEL